MSEEFSNISKGLDTLTLAQVAERINVKNIETAKKWLITNGIKIHRFMLHQRRILLQLALEPI